jgi:hypothetical protein
MLLGDIIAIVSELFYVNNVFRLDLTRKRKGDGSIYFLNRTSGALTNLRMPTVAASHLLPALKAIPPGTMIHGAREITIPL